MTRMTQRRQGRSFAYRDLWNVQFLICHSALIPADLITLAHFSVSLAISLPNSVGEPESTVPPRPVNRALKLGSSSPALTSRLILSTIAAGVSFGAAMPCQTLAS